MALRVIRKLVSQFNVMKAGETISTKQKVLEILLTEFNLLKIFFEVHILH